MKILEEGIGSFKTGGDEWVVMDKHRIEIGGYSESNGYST